MKVGMWKARVTTGVVAALIGLQGGAASAVSLHDGLISYWRLNEGAGDVANDTGAAGSVADTGALRNAPAWIAGKFNAGLQFDGTTQDVLIPASADMDVNTTGVTLSTWVKLDQLPSEITGGFSGIYDSAPDNYALYLDKGNNELRFKATNAAGASTAAAQHPGIKASSLNTTDWFHVLGVFDGDKGQSKIYLNGQLIDRSSQSSSTTGVPLKGTVRAGQIASIGAQPAIADLVSSNFFKGGISDVAVWNRSLGLAEAQYLYNGGTGNAVGAANPNIAPISTTITPVLPTAQPVVYYKFNGDLTNSGTGGSTLNAVVNGTLPTAYATTNFGSGLDLTSNPAAIDSKVGTGNFLSVNYKLADNGTIATRFTASQLFNFATLWSNSSQGNDWESWVYGDGRIAARANRDIPILGQSLWDLADPEGSNHIAFSWTRNGAEMVMKMYVNGEFVDERVGVWRDSGDTFFIGGGIAADTLTSNHYGLGTFDEFRIYSSALTEAEVLYLSQNAPETVAPSFAGDFNSDGFVNGADLGFWKTGFGKATGAVRADGDADHDGDVDGSDLLIWQREFGSGSATAAAGTVPEPAALLLAGLGIVGGLIARRSRHSR